MLAGCVDWIQRTVPLAKTWFRRTFLLPNPNRLWIDETWSEPDRPEKSSPTKTVDWRYADDPIYDRQRNAARRIWLSELQIDEPDWLLADLWKIVCGYADDAAFLRYQLDDWKQNIIWISPFGTTRIDAKTYAISYRQEDYRFLSESFQFRETADFSNRQYYRSIPYCSGWITDDRRLPTPPIFNHFYSRWTNADRRYISAAYDERAIVRRAIDWMRKRPIDALFVDPRKVKRHKKY